MTNLEYSPGPPLVSQPVHQPTTRKEDVWVQYWRKGVTVRGNHYVLPRGSIGREFIDLLAEEIADRLLLQKV